jgi:hypothetical protein
MAGLAQFETALAENIKVPICDVCNVPVFMFARDNGNCLPGGVNFTAFCHGETERVHVSDQEMHAMLRAGVTEFQFVRAFMKKKLDSERLLPEAGA